MKIVRNTPALPALGLGLLLVAPLGAAGQQPGISSGSGSGTGTGSSAGSFGSTGTGTESSTGLGTTGTGSSALPGQVGPGFRPGVPAADLTRPADSRPSPDGVQGVVPGTSGVDPNLFLDARAVADPGERALALIRIAQTAIFSKQLGDAHTALFEAAPAALAERQALIREQRTVAIVDSLLDLAEERMGNSVDLLQSIDLNLAPPPPQAAPDSNRGSNNLGSRLDSPSSPAPIGDDDPERRRRLREALPEWGLAIDLARRLDEVTARTEALFRVVESEAYSSQRLITDRNPRGFAGSSRPDPGTVPADLRAFADELLVNAARHADLIERPIWRNSAAYSIVSNAAVSSQFPRGFEIARSFSQPEARANILIRLAEGQALNGRQDEATAAYNEAARSVALIPLTDPRETLIGVLIDSLISFGRFEDARACVRMLARVDRQLVAYSAVAESQGRRGLAESARRWISQEIRPEDRALLYRKVNDGLLTAIEQNRSRDLTRSSGLRPQP